MRERNGDQMKEGTIQSAVIKPAEPAKPYVGENGIYVPSEVDCRYHKLLISRELFVEAYNKWIKEVQNESEKLS